MFRNTNQTLDLFDAVIQLRGGGVAEPSARASLADAASAHVWTVAAFHADSDRAVHSDGWERHPCGQEVLCVLSGAVNVYLRNRDDRTEPVATVTAGEAFVVPAGRWHRLSVVELGDLLAITPPAATQHEPASSHQNGGKE